MAITSEIIRHHSDECDCNNCGCPLDVGDRVYFDADRVDIAGCTRGCVIESLASNNM
jgi:hypothetical protein